MRKASRFACLGGAAVLAGLIGVSFQARPPSPFDCLRGDPLRLVESRAFTDHYGRKITLRRYRVYEIHAPYDDYYGTLREKMKSYPEWASVWHDKPISSSWDGYESDAWLKIDKSPPLYFSVPASEGTTGYLTTCEPEKSGWSVWLDDTLRRLRL